MKIGFILKLVFELFFSSFFTSLLIESAIAFPSFFSGDIDCEVASFLALVEQE